MERKIRKKEFGLLPVYFRKIGLVVMILAFVPAIIVKAMNLELMQTQKEMFRVLTLNAVILGLLFFAWSRDKIEDEMTLSIRLKSMSVSFIFAVLIVIIMPFVDFLFKDPIVVLTGQHVVISMLFFYLIMYYLQKRGR